MPPRLKILLLFLGALPVCLHGGEPAGDWWPPGKGEPIAESSLYANGNGALGLFNAAGSVQTANHPFFEPIGTNGRACVTCHQPADGMSLSLETINTRWRVTKGADPLFAAIDGSNCPSLPQTEAPSHSLLLRRGLIRIALPWPPRDHEGRPVEPEFDIEVVRDPARCNSDSIYGLTSADPHVSVYRRPRPVANFKYFAVPRGPGLGYNIKDGTPLDRDPDTGWPVAMNLLADAREPTLKTQAIDAALTHLETDGSPSAAQLAQIVEFEQQLYVAQQVDNRAGLLAEVGGPDSLGPQALAAGTPGLGDNLQNPVFGYFEAWRDGQGDDPRAAFRASVARGSDVFFTKPFWIRDATHINSIGLGNPLKRSCATCHNARMTGMDLAPGWVDLGTTTYPTWTEGQTWREDAELPVFKLTCHSSARPHPYLGRTIYTHDPGRALVSGRCVDIGSITMQQMRGLAARPPYFANGSAASLAEVVDYYDRRFNIAYTEQERQDLINFLSVL